MKVGIKLSESEGAGKQPIKTIKPEDDYETQGHLRTLQDAHGIVNDPDKMKKVHALAGRHMKALTGIQAMSKIKEPKPQVKSIQDLKDISNKMNAPMKDDDGDGE